MFTSRVHITFWSSYIKTFLSSYLTSFVGCRVCKVKLNKQKTVLKLLFVSVQLNEFGSMFLPLRKVYPASRHFKLSKLLVIKKHIVLKCSKACFNVGLNRSLLKPFIEFLRHVNVRNTRINNFGVACSFLPEICSHWLIIFLSFLSGSAWFILYFK